MEQILYLCAGKEVLQLHKIHDSKESHLLPRLSLKLEYVNFSMIHEGNQK